MNPRHRHVRALPSIRVPEFSDPMIGPYLRYLGHGFRAALGDRELRSDVWIVTRYGAASVPQNDIMVFVQIEHSLSSEPDPMDTTENRYWSRREIRKGGEENWHLRLLDKETIARANTVIEYSGINLEHVLQSPYRSLYTRKAFYISPFFLGRTLPVSLKKVQTRRPIALQTVTSNGRRAAVMGMLREKGIRVKSLKGLAADSPSQFLADRIELNIHQTENFQTLEELRVAPSLQRGNVLISEPSAFSQSIRYFPLVVFREVEELPEFIRALKSGSREATGIIPDPCSRHLLIERERRYNELVFGEIASRLTTD
jgi:hypothetical protein